MDILSLLGSRQWTDGYSGRSGSAYTQTGTGSFADRLGAAAGMAAQAQTGPKIVYMKTEDMLYSGGNGTGLSFYIKYAETSTEEDPVMIAKGVDERGQDFEKLIHVKAINPRNATIVEMRALEAYTGVEKKDGFSSLPYSQGCLGLNERRDFISSFQKDISDYTLLRERRLADYSRYSMQVYLDFMKGSFSGI